MQRLITALVLLPLLLWVILAGTPWMFALLLVLLTGIGLYEFYQMALKKMPPSSSLFVWLAHWYHCFRS